MSEHNVSDVPVTGGDSLRGVRTTGDLVAGAGTLGYNTRLAFLISRR
jgi:CBS domain-containing protein